MPNTETMSSKNASVSISNQAFIEIRNVTKIFSRDASEVRALDNVSLSLNKGEFLALMGPSGSGKSTLLNLIAGIEFPTSGTVIVNGKNVFRLSDSVASEWRNRNIGYVFQTFNLVSVLTAFENVELPLLLTDLSADARQKQVTTTLELVGLGDRMDHLPKQLSGGQEQRVAIARAIATDPEIILADEPTGDLDNKAAEDVLELLSRLNTELKKTVIMVTHDPDAARYAHDRKFLEKGVLLESSAKVKMF